MLPRSSLNGLRSIRGEIPVFNVLTSCISYANFVPYSILGKILILDILEEIWWFRTIHSSLCVKPTQYILHRYVFLKQIHPLLHLSFSNYIFRDASELNLVDVIGNGAGDFKSKSSKAVSGAGRDKDRPTVGLYTCSSQWGTSVLLVLPTNFCVVNNTIPWVVWSWSFFNSPYFSSVFFVYYAYSILPWNNLTLP